MVSVPPAIPLGMLGNAVACSVCAIRKSPEKEKVLAQEQFISEL